MIVGITYELKGNVQTCEFLYGFTNIIICHDVKLIWLRSFLVTAIMRRQGTIDSQLSMEDAPAPSDNDVTVEDTTVVTVKDGDAGVCDWTRTAVADCHMWVPSTSGVEELMSTIKLSLLNSIMILTFTFILVLILT